MSQTDPVPVLYSETTEDPGQPDGSTAADEEVNVIRSVCLQPVMLIHPGAVVQPM